MQCCLLLYSRMLEHKDQPHIGQSLMLPTAQAIVDQALVIRMFSCLVHEIQVMLVGKQSTGWVIKPEESLWNNHHCRSGLLAASWRITQACQCIPINSMHRAITSIGLNAIRYLSSQSSHGVRCNVVFALVFSSKNSCAST